MAYVKTTWATGDVVTAAKLNNMENGIAANDTAKAPLASPTFTGTPTAPTAAKGTSTQQLATTAFVQNEIAYLPDAAGSNGTYVINQNNGNMSLTDIGSALLSALGLSVVDGALNITYTE